MYLPSNLVLILMLLVTAASANDVHFYVTNYCHAHYAYRGCTNIDAGTCCFSTKFSWAVSISTGPNEVAVGWVKEKGSNNSCEKKICTVEGPGIQCCRSRFRRPVFTGGAAVSVSNLAKCNSSVETNVFGFGVSGGAFWQISALDVVDTAGEESSFASLQATFENLPAEQQLE